MSELILSKPEIHRMVACSHAGVRFLRYFYVHLDEKLSLPIRLFTTRNGGDVLCVQKVVSPKFETCMTRRELNHYFGEPTWLSVVSTHPSVPVLQVMAETEGGLSPIRELGNEDWRVIARRFAEPKAYPEMRSIIDIATRLGVEIRAVNGIISFDCIEDIFVTLMDECLQNCVRLN